MQSGKKHDITGIEKPLKGGFSKTVQLVNTNHKNYEVMRHMETFFGILIPFLGTTLGAACVFFMKRSLGDLVQRSLAGFA